MRRLFPVLLAAVIAASSGGCRVRPLHTGPANNGPGTAAAARRFLEGRWTLQSFELFPRDRPPIQITGSGTLSYDAYANLDMQVRVDEASARLLEREGIQTENGVLSSKGRAVVDMQSRTLTYVMDGQPPLGAPSGPVALNRQRHWQVEGNVLTLTTNGDDGRPVAVAKWTKDSPLS